MIDSALIHTAAVHTAAIASAIPWWGWALIWTGLVVALLAMLVLLGWWIFRKGIRLMEELDGLAALADTLDAGEAELPRQPIAVLAEAADVSRREDERRAHRLARKTARHDERMARAERIARVNVSATQWPPTWYR